ncbi:hypothetical protein [Peptoniphilus sp.]|uniref:hypothetical protein n=1 Tax=Peptoniphilus sp. TaxID=1971214 RepID=UPI003991FBC7
MRKLIVIYDEQEKDESRDSYIKGIKKQIPDAIISPIGDMVDGTYDKCLVLKPMDQEIYDNFSEFLKNNPIFDIEGIHTGDLTITAEAILKSIGKVENKTVIIINQSNILGKPLAKELIERRANVISLNSSYEDIENLIIFTKVDILITATNNYNFKIDRYVTKDIETKIDLSDDLDTGDKIKHLPTIEVLKERLQE